MAWSLCTTFSECIGPLGGCLLLHRFGVYGARGTCCKALPKKWNSRARRPDATTQNYHILREDRRHMTERVFFCGCGDVERTGRPQCHRKHFSGTALERFVLSNGTSYRCQSWCVMVDDMVFHDMLPLGVAPHQSARNHLQRQKRCKRVGRK